MKIYTNHYGQLVVNDSLYANILRIKHTCCLRLQKNFPEKFNDVNPVFGGI